ncbi:12046_t:CDS:2, partial [Gigaspora margarita]
IRGVQGCQPFPQNVQPPSDSVFYIVDTRNIQAQQIVENIASMLRRTYGQRGVPTLGRMYSVVAERKGAFKVTEIHDVFIESDKLVSDLGHIKNNRDAILKGNIFHVLVARAFIPNLEIKPYVNHINGVKHDNRSVLEW